jgi:hypothetical protein
VRVVVTTASLSGLPWLLLVVTEHSGGARAPGAARDVEFGLGKLVERLPATSVRLARELVPKQADARAKATETLMIEETGL